MDASPLMVLLIGGAPDDRLVARRLLAEAAAGRHALAEVASGAEALAAVQEMAADCVLLALAAPDPEAPELLAAAAEATRRAAEAQVRDALAAEQLARQAAEAATARSAQLQLLTAALAQAPTDAVIQRVFAEHGTAASGAAAILIALLDPSAALLHLVDWTGRGTDARAAKAPLALSDPMPMQVAVLERAPVWIATPAEAEARFPGFRALMAKVAVQAVAVMPLLANGDVLGAISFGFSTPQGFGAEERGLLHTLCQQCAQALERVRLYRDLQASQSRLQHLSQRLLETQEHERRHLARELHDEVGQALTGLRLELELLSRTLPEGQAASLAGAHRMTRELIGQIQTLSLDLRPAMLDDQGLLPAVLWLIARYREQSGISVALRQRGLDQRLPPEVETVAYRVVQEALTNIARHAGVAQASVAMLATPAQLLVQVHDAGRGFVLEEALAGGRSSGLLGMQERVGLLGGALSIETAPGAGTTILAELPLERTAGL